MCPKIVKITSDQIKKLYDKYLELIHLEVLKFGVKPTEVRHLIGMLGEFYCALKVNSSLAHTPNQHGFDVLSESGRRISVKTTAQIRGFVPISASTLDKVDDIIILQYINDGLQEIYYGEINKAVEAARFYKKVESMSLIFQEPEN